MELASPSILIKKKLEYWNLQCDVAKMNTILSACDVITDGMRYDVAEYEKRKESLKE